MIEPVTMLLLLLLILVGLVWWYRYTVIIEDDATVRLQSEHEHFHLHVDLPANLTIQPGDTLEILSMPTLPEGRTVGTEVSYQSRIRLHKASWLQRNLVRTSSIFEVKEIVEHP